MIFMAAAADAHSLPVDPDTAMARIQLGLAENVLSRQLQPTEASPI
jgi:hypothetical protein